MERMNRESERNKNRNHNGNQNEKRHRKRSRGNMKAENARISAVRLYLHYISIHIRSAMQYKTSFFLTTLGQFLFSFNVFMGITFMFQRFHEVKGFTYSEVLICYALVLVEFSLAEMFARGFDSFSGMVRHAEFDRVLVRPRNEILQVLGSKFELSRIGRSFQAIILFIYGVMTVQIDWNLTRVLTVLFMLIGGAAVFSGLFMVYAALCFFTLDGLEFMNVLTDGAREYGKYPIGIYGKRMPAVLYRDCSVCADSILSALIFARKNYFSLEHGNATICCYFFDPVLCAVAHWRAPLQVKRVVRVQ